MIEKEIVKDFHYRDDNWMNFILYERPSVEQNSKEMPFFWVHIYSKLENFSIQKRSYS